MNIENPAIAGFFVGLWHGMQFRAIGANDTDLGREISKYLFYFELAALSGEVSVALYSKLQACARKILAKEEILKEAAKRTTKNADELSQVDEVIEQLRKVANDLTNKTPEQMWKDFKYQDLLDGKKPCFLAGTMVKTENGLIAIEKIEVGTKVLSYNFETQKIEYQTVLQTFSNYAEKYVVIHTETEVLKVTGAHLFYVPNENKWLAASQLKVAMHLVDDNQNKVVIKNIDIIKAERSTYNLEVAENHNYYVGDTQLILTHNDGKRLKFTSEVLMDFEFYEYLDFNNKPTYVGQTTQGITKRGDQHDLEFKKNPTKKEFIKISRKGALEITVNGQRGPFKMTPFEAAVTEMHELQTRGGKQINGKGLFNKKNPVSKRTFERIKNKYPNFNPCRFYY